MPVKITKTKGGYRVKTPNMVHAKATTKAKATRQARLYRTHTTILDIPEDDEKALKWLRKQKEYDKLGYNTIWSMKRESVSTYKHPTQKPVELICYALRNSSKADDIVVDFFGGSGATLIACEKMNRGGYLIELDEKFVDIIVQRYVDYVDNPVVKCNNKDVTKLWKKTEHKPN